MSEFSELVKRFDKIRSYVRDFYVYGFKTREDYQYKSSRTYDNERRRIESWFSDYISFDYDADRKKSVAITLDSSRIDSNPLYHVWKTKSFTSNDLMLHFFLLDLLQDQTFRGVETITDELQSRYQVLFDPQTIRKKLTEYVEEGLFMVRREGRQHQYGLVSDICTKHPDLIPSLQNAICFFQGTAPFGFIGSTILDTWQKHNRQFRFRHDYLMHTLEDEILLPLLQAIRNHQPVTMSIKSTKSGASRLVNGIPLKILVSTQTGRRYVCIREQYSRRLSSYRLDGIQNTKLLEPDTDYEQHQIAFEKNIPFTWGVSFGTRHQPESVCFRIIFDETSEQHILHRLEREGRNGIITRLEPGLYEYTVSCWDAFEVLPWVKTFTGRILSFTCTNPIAEQRFWSDMRKMSEMYLKEKTAAEMPNSHSIHTGD